MTLSIRPIISVVLVAALSTLSAPAAANDALEVEGNVVRIPAVRVQEYLGAAFPQQYAALGGLLMLTARDPSFEIAPGADRLQLAFSADAASSGGTPTPVGRVAMSSRLRYAPKEYALYLDQPTLDDIQPATSGQRVDAQTRMLLNLFLADYATSEPIYRLDPSMVSMLGTVNVESATIQDGRIVVRLNQNLGWSPPVGE